MNAMAGKAATPHSESEVYRRIAEHTRLTAAQVKAVFDALIKQIRLAFSKGGPQVFTIPGICKISVKKRPAAKARKRINRFTREPMVFRARPASSAVVVRLLRPLEASPGAYHYLAKAKVRRRPPPPESKPPSSEPKPDGGTIYKVWFGTNRRPIKDDQLGCAFGNRRGNGLVCGWCKVFIPDAHRFGSIGSFKPRFLRRKDDRIAIRQRKSYTTTDSFLRNISAFVSSLPKSHREGLIFLHGFSVSFDEAAIRAAQIGCDLRVAGPMGFFSWPSKGRGGRANYRADVETIGASERYIEEFISHFVRSSGCNRVHLLAHSMGNRGLVRVVERICNSPPSDVKFGQVFLCAPDVDRDTFRNIARAYEPLSKRTTLYVCPRDIALQAAKWLHSANRAGLSPPITVVPGIDTIEVTKFNLLNLGHGYYAAAESVLTDMFDLLKRNASPDDRQRPRPPRSARTEDYWILV